MPFIMIFLIVPFVELAVFASVSEHIGIWTTLSLAFITAIIGGLLVKYQGLQTLFSMRRSMNAGEMPLNEIFDGFCLVAAGALLITPGFVTDTIGFALLIPPIRIMIREFLRKRMTLVSSSAPGQRPRQTRPSDVIEGEYERVDDEH